MTLWMNWNACSQAATSRLTDTLLEAWVRPWLRITTSSNCCRPQLGVTMVRATVGVCRSRQHKVIALRFQVNQTSSWCSSSSVMAASPRSTTDLERPFGHWYPISHGPRTVSTKSPVGVASRRRQSPSKCAHSAQSGLTPYRDFHISQARYLIFCIRFSSLTAVFLHFGD